jgi:hypothetical protein
MSVNINIQPASWILAGNKVQYRVGGDNYLDGSNARPDYKIMCKLYRADIIGGSLGTAVLIGTFQGIPTILQTFVASSVTYYYVDFDMSASILADLPEAPMEVTAGRTTPNLFRVYKCDFYEYYDGVAGTSAISSVVSALPSGRPQLRDYSSDSIITSYLTAGATQRFLNITRPKGRIIWGEFLRLNFYNTYTSGFLNLKCTAYYRNGADDTNVSFYIYASAISAVNIINWQVLLSGVSWNTTIGDPFYGAGLTDAFTELGIYRVKFEVYNVTGSTTLCSEALTFDVIHLYKQRLARAYYFKNSLGFMECFVTTGKRETKDKLTSLDADLYIDNSNASTTKIIAGSLNKYNKKINTEVKQATGYIDRSQFELFKDLLRSELVYEKIGDYHYPIIITDSEVDGTFDDQRFFGRIFTYQYANLEGYVE